MSESGLIFLSVRGHKTVFHHCLLFSQTLLPVPAHLPVPFPGAGPVSLSVPSGTILLSGGGERWPGSPDGTSPLRAREVLRPMTAGRQKAHAVFLCYLINHQKSQENVMGLKKTYHHFTPEKRVAVMPPVQNGFSGAAIAGTVMSLTRPFHRKRSGAALTAFGTLRTLLPCSSSPAPDPSPGSRSLGKTAVSLMRIAEKFIREKHCSP